MELSVRGEPFDGLRGATIGLHRQQQAGSNRGSVEPDGAGAANAVLAADVCPGEPERVPKEVREQEPWLDLLTVGPAVDGELDGDHAARSQA
jgi:hypothetical protein